MGFEPMNATLRGWCVKPLHQRVIKNRLMSILYYMRKKYILLLILKW